VGNRAINLIGNTYGKLTVGEYLGHSVWRCLCTCGNTRDVQGYSLTKQITTQCLTCQGGATITGRPRKEDLTGRVFTELTVLEYLGFRIYRCRCTCGGTREVDAANLKSGGVTRCSDCQSEVARETAILNRRK
jgi:hypothetical protein